MVRVQRGASARSGSGSSRWVPVSVPVWGWLLGLGCFVTGHQVTGHPPGERRERPVGVVVVVVVVIVGRWREGGTNVWWSSRTFLATPGVPLVYCGYRLCEKSFATSVRRHWSRPSLHFSPVGQWLLQWLLQRSGCCSSSCYSGMGWTPSTPSGLCQSPLDSVERRTGRWRRQRGIALAGGGG